MSWITTFRISESFVALICIALLLWSIGKNRRRLPLPPGPSGLPLVGNLFEMPRVKPWLVYHMWAERYKSGMIFLQLPFQPMIIVDSVKVAFDLMEKRSNIYSDKPISIMDELTGWSWNLALQRYGPRWRATRRYFHEYFYKGTVHQYHPVQTREVRAFLRRVWESSGSIDIRSVNQIFAAVIMDVVYGIKVDTPNDEYIVLMEHGVESFGESKVPGAFWVDSFPFLRYIPAWMPGAAAQKYGAYHKPIVTAMRDKPFAAAEKDMLSGTGKLCMVAKLIDRVKALSPAEYYGKHQEFARDAAAIAYVAGVETTLNSTVWFILAMAMHPSVQDKAHQELDSVLGTGKLPEHDDIDALPYIQAVVLETLRWRPAVPLGIPHRVMVEDEYDGYFVPKGSMIVPNAWAMLHDPVDYPNPEDFNPDRFLKDGQINHEVRDPSTITFGFGRRICPGRYFAKDILFLAVASILSVFDVRPVTDENGIPVQLSAECPGYGIVLHADNVDKCALKPRSAAAEQLIRECESV